MEIVIGGFMSGEVRVCGSAGEGGGSERRW
jgi:hypothetical protein